MAQITFCDSVPAPPAPPRHLHVNQSLQKVEARNLVFNRGSSSQARLRNPILSCLPF